MGRKSPGKCSLEYSNGVYDYAKLQPKSQALVYHVHLKEVFESHPQSPAIERTKVCFDILDKIAGGSGPLSGVIEVISSELKKSCFSENLTATTTEPFYEIVPYFMLVKERVSARQVEEVNALIEELHAKLKIRSDESNLAYRQIIMLKNKVNDLEKCNAVLTDEVINAKIMAENAENEKNLALQRLRATESRFEKEAAEAKHIFEKTRAAYEELCISRFDNSKKPLPEDSIDEKNSIDASLTAPGILEFDVEQATYLEKQFAKILDKLLDDLESNTKNLMVKVALGADAESINQERQNLMESYVQQINAYRDEMKLLKDHKSLLLEQKRRIETAKLHSIEPPDVTLRKNALIMHISYDKGNNFQLHDDNRYCSKCGERVLACPHIALHCNPITLTNSILKFSRPALRMKVSLNNQNSCVSMLDGVATEDEDDQVTPTFFKIWKEFYESRGGFKPLQNRKISLNNLLDFVESLYTQKFIWDREGGYPLQSLQESFYRLMHEKYAIEEITIKACHDWLTSFQEQELNNEQIRIFIMQLSGIYQEHWKYMMLVKVLFADIAGKPLHLEVLQEKIRALYPNRSQEAYKCIELDYMEFCKDKISMHSFLEHCFVLLTQESDPNISLMKLAIASYDIQQVGILSKVEFGQIILQSIPLVDKTELDALYSLAEKEFGIDQVINDRLAMIGAYLIVSTSFKNEWKGDIVVGRYVQDPE